ncbi:MAG: hypothetical protein M3N07_02045 [Pseudomonadota bacterium]|nr:hypothetical protein [Pseudomonadota bacterium]
MRGGRLAAAVASGIACGLVLGWLYSVVVGGPWEPLEDLALSVVVVAGLLAGLLATGAGRRG